MDPFRKSALALATSRQLAEEIFGDESSGALRQCLPTLENVTSWLASEIEQVRVPLPSLGQLHQLPQHAANVYRYALGLSAKTRELKGATRKQLAIGAFLHDIGMTGRQQNLSREPRSLSRAEYALIRQHTLWGPGSLTGAPNLDPPIGDVIRHHHERMDGSGYPDGLSGDSISPPARIVAITSVFNALTSNKPQRQSYSAFGALEMMRKMSGQFDPGLLREFVLVLGENAHFAKTANGASSRDIPPP